MSPTRLMALPPLGTFNAISAASLFLNSCPCFSKTSASLSYIALFVLCVDIVDTVCNISFLKFFSSPKSFLITLGSSSPVAKNLFICN